VEWRILPLEIQDAFTAMATDEAIMEAVSRNEISPTIRFWRWQPSAVSIGYFQSLMEEVNLDKCRELGIDVVRRKTGGGAVFHDFSGEITYSVIGPEKIFPKGIHESYSLICSWIVDGLRNLGISSEFRPINDIVVNGKKISGNAQTRRREVLWQHGTVLYDLDVKKMFSLLKVGGEKISDKMIRGVEERVTRVLDHKKVGMEKLYDALLKGFTDGKNFRFDRLTEDEKDRARFLAGDVYLKKEWNFKR